MLSTACPLFLRPILTRSTLWRVPTTPAVRLTLTLMISHLSMSWKVRLHRHFTVFVLQTVSSWLPQSVEARVQQSRLSLSLPTWAHRLWVESLNIKRYMPRVEAFRSITPTLQCRGDQRFLTCPMMLPMEVTPITNTPMVTSLRMLECTIIRSMLPQVSVVGLRLRPMTT